MPETRETKIDKASLCSAKQMARWFGRRSVGIAFVALIRLAKDKAAESQTEDQGVKSEVEWMFHQNTPDNIKAVVAEFADVCPLGRV